MSARYSRPTLARRCPACCARPGQPCRNRYGAATVGPHRERESPDGRRQYMSRGVSVGGAEPHYRPVARDYPRHTL